MRRNKSGSVCPLAGNKYSPLCGAFVYVIVFLAVLAILGLSGCAGLSGASNTSNPPAPSTLQINNVQVTSASTSTSQIVWTTNIAADSAVDYGTTTSYGSSTQVDSTMVTSHQVGLSGLAAGTTYYYQVRSTDSKNNHAYSGGHTFQTSNASPRAPTITTQPTSQTVTAGQTASFSVTATGTSPLGYQWYRNGAVISGATSSSYTTGATTGSDNGTQFTVVVNNTAGSVTSSAATLTVNAASVAPTITTQPASQTVTAGQTASFSVTATGTSPLGYQWYRNGAVISGATSSSYTTGTTTSSDNGAQFTVVVNNTAGTVTSAAATLTVNPPPAPSIQVNPTSISFGNVVVGNTLSQTLILTNTGTATLTITQVTASGAGFTASGFALPLNVSAGQQTTITVAFLPTSTGAASGGISIVSNAPTSPSSVSLSGTGIAATFILGINPTSLSFGNVTTGTSSPVQNVIISDTGNFNVTISQITLSGAGYSMTGGSAPVTLTPSQSITVAVQFSPTVAGSVNGNISIVSNAIGSPASVSLTGAGVVPVQHSVALTWTASTSTVSGYRVYRSTVSGGAYALLNSSPITALAYTDSTVQNAVTYYYVTTAVDALGIESVYSNEVQAVIP